jgi:type II secretory pathway component GspD/PulD (secretin)
MTSILGFGGIISLASGRPVPKSDLLFVLESAVRREWGLARSREHRIPPYIIPMGDAVGAGNLDSAVARAEPGYWVSVVSLRYTSAATLVKLLDSFAAKPGTVRADTSRNLLLIQGSGAERCAAIETVLGFDVDWMRGHIFPIRYSSPDPIVAKLEKILDAGENGLSQNIVKFQDPRASGQTVLLAGLIQQQLTRGGVRLLDQIPTLGDAVSHQTKAVNPTELIAFIRPQIIRDSVDAHFVAEELRTKLRGVLGAVQPDVSPSPKVR